MRHYSSRFGTMMRLRGVGDTFNALDAEDYDMGTSFSMVNDPAPPMSPIYADAGPLTESVNGNWVDQAFQLAEKALTLDQIRKLQNVNLDRVRSGLAPLPASVFQQVRPQVAVGVAPDTQRFLWIALGVAAAVGLLAAFSRR